MHDGHDYRSAGVSVYTRNLLAALPRTGSGAEFIAFHGRDAGPVSGVRSVLSPLPTWTAPARIAWEQTGFLWQASAQRLDLIHGTVNVLPLAIRCPTVVTVHDLAFLRHPERFPAAKTAYLRMAVKLSVRKAARVIAVSASTRSDLISLMGVSPERVDVVYPGVDPAFRPYAAHETETFLERHSDGRPYILHVGTLEPRKNIDVLIRAYAAGRKSGWPHALALVGAKGWMYESLTALVHDLELDKDVRFIEFAGHDELPLWYNCADLLAYPSAYEGFGLPVLEAMACGAPVVTSTSSSLTELAAGACLTVEPGSEEALQMAIARVLSDQDLARRLRAAGLARAAEFSWDETARRTIETYERVA
jgi:glycosyltransferase involved in cell wall biosynthesis